MELADVTWILLSVTITLIVYCCMKLYERHNYWKNKNIAHLKPKPLVGNVFQVMLLKQSFYDIYKEAYFQFPKENLVGIYELFSEPVLIIRDIKLVDRILVKDFQHFTDHPQISNNGGLFTYGLFQLKGTPWRSIRHKLSPAFSTGKIKDMFSDMLNSTEQMFNLIEENLNKDYKLRDAISAFVVDVIASTVFGINIKEKVTRDEFARLGTTVFHVGPIKFIQQFALTQFPNLASSMGMTFLESETEVYFHNLIAETFKQRNDGQTNRNDFTQQLLSLKKLGAIEVKSKDQDDDYLNLDSAAPTENVEISEILLAGQAFQFFTAGFDVLMVTMTYVLYDLSRYPEIQERARRHTQEVLDKHGGYTYEALKDMTYLEQCIQETLRFYPVSVVLGRMCTKSFYIPEAKLMINKGQKVIIPINAIQMDPKYYPDPEVYNPERFPPNTTKSNTYLPFGDGPRICIAIRYALVVMKLGLAKLLTQHKFSLSPKTEIPFTINKQSFLFVPKKDILFNISKI